MLVFIPASMNDPVEKTTTTTTTTTSTVVVTNNNNSKPTKSVTFKNTWRKNQQIEDTLVELWPPALLESDDD
jgi:hypothetical protein